MILYSIIFAILTDTTISNSQGRQCGPLLYLSFLDVYGLASLTCKQLMYVFNDNSKNHWAVFKNKSFLLKIVKVATATEILTASAALAAKE